MRKAGLPASVSYLTQEPTSAEASSSSETSKIADRNNFHERNTPEPLSVPSMFSIPDGSQAADCAPELQQVPAGFAVISTRGDIGGKGLPRATSCGEDIRTGELNLWPKRKNPPKRVSLVRSRRLELPRVAPQRPQRCASTNSATTASW